MKNLILVIVTLLISLHSNNEIQLNVSTSGYGLQDDSRVAELNRYWATLAKTAQEGDFDGMKSLYHADAVLVKTDTTFAISEAFKFRWKKEIMEVKNGKRNNTLEFRFSKRIGDEITAFEEGIYHYTSIETSTGKKLGDSYIHFESLLVKQNNQWVTLMEYQKMVATEQEWESLK